MQERTGRPDRQPSHGVIIALVALSLAVALSAVGFTAVVWHRLNVPAVPPVLADVPGQRIPPPDVRTSAPPAPWPIVRLRTMESVASSSLLRRDDYHPPTYAFDGRRETAWNDGVEGSGQGQWIEARFGGRRRIRRVRFSTGFDHVSARHGDLFYANAHLQTAAIQVDGREVARAAVRHDEREREVELDVVGSTLRIVAAEVYAGSRWQDVCISEVSIEGEPIPPPGIEPPDGAPQRISRIGDDVCVFWAHHGVVTAACANQSYTCTEALRADLAPAPGNEVVVTCRDASGDYGVIALAAQDEVLWTHPLGGPDELSASEEGLDPCAEGGSLARTRLAAVDATSDSRLELLVAMRACYEPGEEADLDVLWKWRDDRMVAVARGSVRCESLGSTVEEEPSQPGAPSGLRCRGAYLDIGGPTRGWALTTRAFPDSAITGDRDGDGRLATPVFGATMTHRWDPAAFRFVPSAVP